MVFSSRIAHQRFAADDRHVQRPVPIDEGEHVVDQFLSLEVAHLAQRDLAAEMFVAVGVAAGAAQRALACDFDRQRGLCTRRESFPMQRRSLPLSNYISDIGYIR